MQRLRRPRLGADARSLGNEARLSPTLFELVRHALGDEEKVEALSASTFANGPLADCSTGAYSAAWVQKEDR